MSVLLETTLGSLVVDLYTEERPKTTMNFLKLCAMKYYNFCLFHAIEEGYMAQTGDPLGTGKGGSSVSGLLYGEQARFMEAEELPKLRHRRRGTLSLVQTGEGLVASQFFLTLDDGLDFLDGKHCVIGHVAEGLDVLDKLNTTIVDEEKRPYQDVRVLHTVVLHDPFPQPKGLCPPSRSPSPDESVLKSARIGVDEAVDETEGMAEAEVQELSEAKEATARANILAMIGDLHEADELPPDNVLFVCKLNAVTTDQDLEIIFARFGKINKCEIIKDRKSGASLQYAFVEFERAEDCESAFFKMDNVLIDDRRIHVDFSQSVSKNSSWFSKFQKDMGGAKEEPKREVKREMKREVKREPGLEAEARGGGRGGGQRWPGRDGERRDGRREGRRDDERRDGRREDRHRDHRRRSPSPRRRSHHHSSSRSHR